MTIEEKYNLYEKLLTEWNGRMNLVAKSTLGDLRGRHINDSAQLAKYIPKDKTVIDMGSGAGFPAVVLAILGYKVIAIESIGKKCRFLETLKKELGLPNLEIINDRVENAVPGILNGKAAGPIGQKIKPKSTDFVFTARAFAPLVRILDWTGKFGIPYILLKGQGAKEEIATALEKYRFSTHTYPSITGGGHVINLTIK